MQQAGGFFSDARSFLIRYGWKLAGALLVAYSLAMGLVMQVPQLPVLGESIRNLFYHVPLWFSMTFLLLASAINSLRYLATNRPQLDVLAAAQVRVALWFGFAGLFTGMVWARTTWGTWWVNDPKLLGAAAGILFYVAYVVLRNSMDDLQRRARVSAVANILFFCMFIPTIFIIPRLTDSLHPGSGGNPAFNVYDLDNRMRWVFYPAVLGWILLGIWMASLSARLQLLQAVAAGLWDQDVLTTAVRHEQ
ncbi:MAG: cytochrome c biogenesis protein CcsA [Chitinophagales bacterium]|nr:cytochrome c biogenesis protein CcsA [Chitinophagales bacterium]MDW8393435.1 cytochrome c biogenesis protein CcsA [Chitinophagales bacterium]